MRYGTLILILVGMLCISLFAWITVSCAQGQVTSRSQVINGEPVGEVLVGEQVVFRIRTAAGGLSPAQRADIVAQRLGVLMSGGVKAEEIGTRMVRGQEVVVIGDEPVITADQTAARLNATTPHMLARQWRSNLESAVTGKPATSGGAAIKVSQKVVPILSVGSGLRVGGALVTGASSRVDEVKAVAQIETDYQEAVRIKILVPVSSEDVIKDIQRVPGTSVAGLVDIGL